MKAKTLIKKLIRLVDTYGDLPVTLSIGSDEECTMTEENVSNVISLLEEDPKPNSRPIAITLTNKMAFRMYEDM